MSGPVLVRARHVLTGHDGVVVDDGGVLVADGRVVAVGTRAELARDAVAEVDAGAVVMPGLVDAHSHLRGTPLSAQGIAARPLESWLCSLAAATPLDPGDDVLVAASDLLETGVTAVQAFVHSFAAPAELAALWAETAAAAERSGIRALLCAGFADNAEFAPQPATGAWTEVAPVAHGTSAAEFGDLVSSLLGDDDPWRRVRWGVGPVAPQWVGEEGLAVVAGRAAGRRMHAHLNESRWQRRWVQGQAAPVARLADAGCLDARLSAAHGVDLLPDELDALAAAGVTLVHCPTSNRALAVGTAHVAEWGRHGVAAALGMDSGEGLDGGGEPADMFQVLRAAVADAAAIGDPITPLEAFAMATTGGARALGVPGLGRLTPGAPADLVGIELPDVRRGAGAHDLVEQIVRAGSPALVRSAWVEGAAVVAAGRAVVESGAARHRLAQTLAADAGPRAARRRRLRPLLDELDLLIADSAA